MRMDLLLRQRNLPVPVLWKKQALRLESVFWWNPALWWEPVLLWEPAFWWGSVWSLDPVLQ